MPRPATSRRGKSFVAAWIPRAAAKDLDDLTRLEGALKQTLVAQALTEFLARKKPQIQKFRTLQKQIEEADA